ncbi:RNA polymerase sigma factor [Microbacterium sp. SORGH_AS_0862]|uniref:RNA polymerase sigma factor n=1 Tax=Microbacterium sp. SORGH_AS_0862 TaxID=3041789 RepID=UPI002791FF3A|nr:RNA polymerase sigma factor [Microbacterium sp. SORGH_AS_0862]MDQ1205225.1 RNA polymerase sigma factor (sigma-70 family) [Microbacterium sp. SORGH_AS_0862]
MSAIPDSAARERIAQEFHDHAPALVRYARRLGANEATAEDAVAESFATVLTFDAERLLGIENLRAYLYTVTRSALRRIQEHEARVLPTTHEKIDRAVPDFSEGISLQVSVQLAQRAMSRLDARQLALLQHVVIDARPAGEVGVELGMTPTGVRTAVQRARAAVRYAYALEYLELAPPACGFDTGIIARVVTDRAGARERRRYREHCAGCELCPRLERNLLDELAAGSLVPVLAIALPVSAAAIVAPASSARADSPRRMTAAALLIAVAALAVAAAALMSLPHDIRSDGADATIPAMRVDVDSVDIRVDPGLIPLLMPAPGEQRDWQTSVSNASRQPVMLLASLSGDMSHSDEAPMLSLSRDGETALRATNAGSLPITVSLGRLGPGSSAHLSGDVVRDLNDVRQDLSGAVTVTVWAAVATDEDPPLGTLVDGMVPRETLLPVTGVPPEWAWLLVGTACLALGAGGLTLSLRSPRRR